MEYHRFMRLIFDGTVVVMQFLIPYFLGMDLVFLGPVDVSVGPTPRTENQ